MYDQTVVISPKKFVGNELKRVDFLDKECRIGTKGYSNVGKRFL